jgi:hypothetical protein
MTASLNASLLLASHFVWASTLSLHIFLGKFWKTPVRLCHNGTVIEGQDWIDACRAARLLG